MRKLHHHTIDPKTLQPVPDGEEGEIVITTLVKEGAPLLRFRTHDISRIIPGECACGNKYPRLDIIKGRSDDMFKVHGVNMFPSQVEEILGMVDGVSSEYNINIAHDEAHNRDIIMVTVEAEGRVDFEQTGQTIDRIREIIKSTIGTITKTEIMRKCPDISQVTVQRALAELVEKGEVLKLGGGRYTKYTWNNES